MKESFHKYQTCPIWLIRATGHKRGQDGLTFKLTGTMDEMLLAISRLRLVGYQSVKQMRVGETKMEVL